ncbi:MAG: phosphate ABC transporter substrate-binding protein PstS [Pseudomonadota bacterium]
MVLGARHNWPLLAAACLLLQSCEEDPGTGEVSKQPERIRSTVVVLRGAGATFPKPIYTKWGLTYFELKRVKLDYQALGSDAGVKAISEGHVDFGASDIPLAVADLERLGLLQFPMIAGAIVPVVHLPGIASGQLLLTAELIAQIYLGKIRRWNDPALVQANPSLVLPDQDIIAVFRADASGSTWLLSSLLTELSPQWKASMGVGSTLNWPTGVGAQGSEQMARFIHRFDYTIGYVQLSLAKAEGLSWTRMKNRRGAVVEPEDRAVQVAAMHAITTSSERLRVAPVEQLDAQAWPLTTASYLLIRREVRNPDRARRMLEFFAWCLDEGRPLAQALHYVAVPEPLVAATQRLWGEYLRADGEALWPPPLAASRPGPSSQPAAAAQESGPSPDEIEDAATPGDRGR